MLADTYSFGDVTKKVVSSLSINGRGIDNRPLICTKSAKEMGSEIIEALDKRDNMSEKEVKNSLKMLEQYVDLVEKQSEKGR